MKKIYLVTAWYGWGAESTGEIAFTERQYADDYVSKCKKPSNPKEFGWQVDEIDLIEGDPWPTGKAAP